MKRKSLCDNMTGQRMWVFDGNVLEAHSPRPLTDLGLPGDLPGVDAAFAWGKNGRTYVFARDRYWKLNEALAGVESGYPLPIADRWRGVRNDLDGVFTWKSGSTYFFKANAFWRFNDEDVLLETRNDHPTSKFWLGCRE